jgi:hypothetical protein
MADASYQPAVYRKQGGAELVIASGGLLTFESGGYISGAMQLDSTTTAALTMGAGTSASPVTTSTANKNHLGFWFESTATSGDARGLYLRQYFAGAGVSGEAARIFGTVNNVAAATGGTVNGAHISLSVSGASGSISGAGNALRATLGLGANTVAGGTLAVIQVDTDFDAAATVPATCAGIRFTKSGTGELPFVFAFDSVNAGVWDDDYSTEVSTIAGALKVLVNGSTRYIPLYSGAPS